MPPGRGLDVAGIACRVFDTIVAHYDALDPDLLPPRRVIAPGESRSIAWDCDQFVLTFSGVGNGAAPGLQVQPRRQGNPISSMGLRHAVYVAQIVRCVPEPDDAGQRPPKPETLREAALHLMADAGLLSQALIDVCTQVGDGLPKGTHCQAGAVETLGPLGGFAAVEGSIAVTAGTLV